MLVTGHSAVNIFTPPQARPAAFGAGECGQLHRAVTLEKEASALTTDECAKCRGQHRHRRFVGRTSWMLTRGYSMSSLLL